MSGKSQNFSQALLKLILQGVALPGLAANDPLAPLSLLYVSLHTADPGPNGVQNVNEATYGSYSRVALPRSALGFTVTSNTASPAGSVTFPTATSGSETETFMGIGTAPNGAGLLLWSGAISPSIAVSNGVQPVLSPTSILTEN